MRSIKDNIMKTFIYLASIITVSMLVWILGYILFNGLGEINIEFLKGITPSILNTLFIVLLTLLISVPIGIMCAIYLNEYAKSIKFINIISLAVDSLAGIPSILYGLFGLTLFVTILGFKWSVISGTLTLSIMTLPTIIRVTQESLKTVPKEYKEGSFALGATKIATLYKIIIPCVSRGIATAVILSIGRIVGETAAVYLTAGMVNRTAGSIFEPGRTLSVHLFLLAKESISFGQAYATATVLIITIIIINTLANFVLRGDKR